MSHVETHRPTSVPPRSARPPAKVYSVYKNLPSFRMQPFMAHEANAMTHPRDTILLYMNLPSFRMQPFAAHEAHAMTRPRDTIVQTQHHRSLRSIGRLFLSLNSRESELGCGGRKVFWRWPQACTDMASLRTHRCEKGAKFLLRELGATAGDAGPPAGRKNARNFARAPSAILVAGGGPHMQTFRRLFQGSFKKCFCLPREVTPEGHVRPGVFSG